MLELEYWKRQKKLENIMCKLKELRIKNFQSHEDTRLSFSEEMTVILGASDVGKSSIIRALKWALFNEPSGDFFIRKGEKDVEVTITFDNGNILVRGRNATKNYYELIHEDGQSKILENFGTGLPEIVTEFTQIQKIKIDEDHETCLNISDQLEGPFLLSERNSLRASALGRISGVHIIDYAVKKLNKELKSEKSENKLREKKINFLSEKLKEYDNLPNLQKKITALEKVLKKVEEKQTILNHIEKIQSSLDSLNQLTLNLKIEIDACYGLQHIQKLLPMLTQKRQSLWHDFYLYENLKENYNRIKENEQDIKLCLNLHHYRTNIMSLERKKNQIQSLFNIRHELYEIKHSSESFKMVKKIPMEYLLKNFSQLNNISKFLIKLVDLNEVLFQINFKLNKARYYYPIYSHCDEAHKKISLLFTKLKQLNFLEELKKELLVFKEDLQKIDKQVKINTSKMEEGYKKYYSLLKKIGKCPFCFQIIENNVLEHIISEIKKER